MNPQEIEDLVRQRTEEEIGTKHIDNNREIIDVEDFNVSETKNFGEYKAEFLEMLAGLKKEILESNSSGQQRQMEGNSAYAEFKIRKAGENQEMEEKAQEVLKNIPELKKILFGRKREWEACKGEQDLVEDSWM